jgi:hypothetical protein
MHVVRRGVQCARELAAHDDALGGLAEQLTAIATEVGLVLDPPSVRAVEELPPTPPAPQVGEVFPLPEIEEVAKDVLELESYHPQLGPDGTARMRRSHRMAYSGWDEDDRLHAEEEHAAIEDVAKLMSLQRPDVWMRRPSRLRRPAERLLTTP